MPVNIGTQVAPYSISAEDIYVLLADDTIFATGDGIQLQSGGEGSAIHVMGGIFASSRGIETSFTDVSILVYEEAEIVAVSDGIYASGDGVSVINHGTVSSDEGYAARIVFSADPGSLVNYGSLHGFLGGARIGSRDTINYNYGTITGSTGVFIDDSRTTLVNHGRIDSVAPPTTDDLATFTLVGVYIGSFGGVATIVNYGTISGEQTAILDDGFATEISNYGAIIGDVILNDGSDVFTNRGEGHVLGDILGGEGADTLTGAGQIDLIFGGSEDDLIYGRGGIDVLEGNEDNDMIYGGNGADQIDGGSGADHLRGGAGDDDIQGGTEDDSLFGNAGSDTLSGDAGADVIFGHDGDDEIYGGENGDDLFGGRDDDLILGGTGNDVAHGDGGDDILEGEGGSDTLYGGGGDDELFGQAGKDVLNGGKGDDILTGGGAADVFVFDMHVGHDLIADFTDGEDQIDLSIFGFQTLGAAKTTAQNFDGGVLFDLSLAGGSGTIFVADIQKSDLNSSEFIL